MFNKLKSLLAPKPSAPAPAAAAPATAAPADAVLINAYCTAVELPPIDFPHTLNARRDLSDPELARHLAGFIGYVRSRGDSQMTRLRYHAIRHIQRVNQHLSLAVAQQDLDAYARWAEGANAIAFLPDGSLRDPQGRILLDAGGQSDEQAQIPYPRRAWERKARSDAQLSARGVRVSDSLPPLVSEPELRLRAPVEVAGRALALLVVAVRAESFVDGQGAIPVADLRRDYPAAFDHLSPREHAFLDDDAPARDDLPQFTWRYEALLLLEWALGLVEALPFPAGICDVPLTARTLMNAKDLMQAATLRPAGEILDALDLHYRLHWAVRQARLDKSDAPAGLEPGVILERHYALNWLVRFEDNDWDEVDTPT